MTPPLHAREAHVWQVTLAASEPAGRREEARRALRLLLAAYAGVAPEAIELAAPPGAKPRLEGPCLAWLRFSLAHAGALALVAVARGRDVGVDLEQVDARRPVETIAARVLPPQDADLLRSVPPGERHAAFCSVWARKEAVLKALGAGLGALRDVDGLGGGLAVVDLPAPPGYRAALAAEPPLDRVVRRAWAAEAS